MLSSAHELAEKYAQAIFDLAQEDDCLPKAKDNLVFLTDVFQNNSQLREFLANPCVPKETRRDTVLGIFKGSLEVVVLNFILLLVEKRLESLLPSILKMFNTLLYAKEGTIEAKVTTARELSSHECENIVAQLSKMLGKPVVLDRYVDSGIIGGIIIQVGDRLIDGSVSRRLDKFGSLLRRINADEKGVAEVG